MGLADRMNIMANKAVPPAPIPPKKRSFFALQTALFLGLWSGALPWFCPLNLCIGLILTYFRLPVHWFFIAFALSKLLVEKYLSAFIAHWGLIFLTSPATLNMAEKITSAPVLCFLNLNDTRVCGGTILGGCAGLALAILLGFCVSAFNKKEKIKKEERPA